MAKLKLLLVKVKADRAWFKAHNLHVESAACAIREQALIEALNAIESDRLI